VLAGRLDRAVEDEVDEGRVRLGLEEPLPRQPFPQHHRRREDIGATIDRPAQHLLGGHVRELPSDLPFARRVDLPQRLCHPKIDDSGHAIDPDQDVVRRDVSMHDVEGLALIVLRLVRGVEPLEHAGHERRDEVHGHASSTFVSDAIECREGLSFDVFHDEEDFGVLGDDVESRYDVGVPHARSEARLVEEHREEVGVERELGVQSLDGDLPRCTVAMPPAAIRS
jgi:hypothetical protein